MGNNGQYYSRTPVFRINGGCDLFGFGNVRIIRKKCTYANTALGFPATRQSTVAMREGGNFENITHNIITVHSRSLVVVVVSSSETLKNSLFHGRLTR